jgi:Family of unknown function (DUF6263)
MKISNFMGRDEFLKKLVKENQAMEPLLKIILSDEALKQMSDPAFAAIPDKPVKKGDTWQKTTMLNMGPIGSFDTNYKFTFDGTDERKLQRIKIDATLKYVTADPRRQVRCRSRF